MGNGSRSAPCCVSFFKRCQCGTAIDPGHRPSNRSCLLCCAATSSPFRITHISSIKTYFSTFKRKCVVKAIYGHAINNLNVMVGCGHVWICGREWPSFIMIYDLRMMKSLVCVHCVPTTQTAYMLTTATQNCLCSSVRRYCSKSQKWWPLMVSSMARTTRPKPKPYQVYFNNKISYIVE